MQRSSRENPEVRPFILANVAAFPDTIASLATKKLGISRVTANRYLQKLCDEGVLISEGKTRARIYRIVEQRILDIKIDLKKYREEDVIYRNNIEPHFANSDVNILDIVQHGCNEMINNAIDHSGSDILYIIITKNTTRTRICLIDEGIGIFRKIKEAHNLIDERHAILELSKGKLTTDPARHSGEGIFFTSRMFSRFAIASGDLYYRKVFDSENDEWLIEADSNEKHITGTSVYLEINNKINHTCLEVFKKYEDDDYGFKKTHVPVRLAKYGQEQLVSRSQARRVLKRFESFTEVMLDFIGVDTIGQAFADEIFRVYAASHPEVAVIPVRASTEVEAMIRHVSAGKLIPEGALSPGSSSV